MNTEFVTADVLDGPLAGIVLHLEWTTVFRVCSDPVLDEYEYELHYSYWRCGYVLFLNEEGKRLWARTPRCEWCGKVLQGPWQYCTANSKTLGWCPSCGTTTWSQPIEQYSRVKLKSIF